MSRLGDLLDEVETHAQEACADEQVLLRARLQDMVSALAVGEASPAGVADVASVRIRLFGCFAVQRDGHDVTPGGLAGTLLRLMALRGGPVHVDTVVEALWPESAPGQGRTRLRNVLARLRDAAGDVVVRQGDCLHLADAVEVDLHRFTRLATRALQGLGAPGGMVRAAALHRAREALELARDELLPADAYAAWAAAARLRQHRCQLALLDAFAGALADDGAVPGAVDALFEAIDVDPYDERRYVRAARLLAASGRRGAADDVLALARCMLDDLGLPPSTDVLALERELRAPH